MSFLLFGSVWFWLVVAVAIILLMVATEKGSGTGATVTFVVAIALLFFFGNKVPISEFFSYAMGHSWLTLSVIVAYFILGTCWAILKWYFFLIDERDRKQEENPNFVYVPKVSEYKGKILLWMFYWPCSAIWTVLDHPIKRVFLFIYGRIKNRMQGMADKIFAPLVNEQAERKKRSEALEEQRGQDRLRETGERIRSKW